MSISRQCELLSIHRSGLYYKPRSETPMNLYLMKIIDNTLFDRPFYGVRRMTHHLRHMGLKVNHKRVARLYRLMDVRVIYPKKNTSKPAKGRAIDNVFIERLWRSVKTEYVHINPANGGIELYKGMKKYMEFYNEERPHQSLEYRTPKQDFEAMKKAA